MYAQNRLLNIVWARPYLLYTLIILGGAATPLAFAPYRLSFMMVLLLGLLFFFAYGHRHAVRLAYLWGLSAYVAQFYWINTALNETAGLPQFLAIPLTLLLPAYLALYPALAFWLVRKLKLSDLQGLALGLPFAWALGEFVRERAFTGFGWGALGYSQIGAQSPLAGFAPVGGIHMVTLAVALITAWLVLALRAPKASTQAGSVIGILLVLGFASSVKNIAFTQPDGTKATVALGQGNIPQTLKWQEDQVMPTFQTYFQQVADTKADILILPETALPLMKQNIPVSWLQDFADTARHNGTALAMGMSQFADDGENYLNVVVNMSDYDGTPGKADPYYAKDHLVPFGEFIPLKSLTNWLYQFMNIPLADTTRGGAGQAPLQLHNQRVAFNICYEDGFGDELIASAKQSSLLANASNMAWYGDSYAMDLHLQQSQARALELGRYMVRSTNTGMTAIIQPDGDIQGEAVRVTRTVLQGEIEGRSGTTPYMRMGSSWPWFWLSTLILAGLAWRARRWAKAQKNQKSD